MADNSKQISLSPAELAEIGCWYHSCAQESQTSAGQSKAKDALIKGLLAKLGITMNMMDKYAMGAGRGR